MRRTKLTASAAFILALGTIYSLGCIFNPKPDDGPNPGPQIDWPKLTAKDDVIEYMLLTYKHRESARYNKLLHPEYIWYLQPEDQEQYGPTLDYAEDTEGTRKLFDRAVMLELEIQNGSWEAIQAVGEEPCEGCWQTEREYTIQAQLPNSETIYTGHDHVLFIAVPVEEGGETKYKIRWAYDLNRL